MSKTTKVDNEEDDIKVEDSNDYNIRTNSEMSSLKKETVKKNTKQRKKYNDYRDVVSKMSAEQIKEAIRDFDPIPITDWPKIPYKSIFIIILLFSSSILFIYTGVNKYKEKEKWYRWFSYIFLGVLLFIPGATYGFILVNILIGRKGYKYEDIPDLSEQ